MSYEQWPVELRERLRMKNLTKKDFPLPWKIATQYGERQIIAANGMLVASLGGQGGDPIHPDVLQAAAMMIVEAVNKHYAPTEYEIKMARR
jgi:hypothetical protein